MQKVMIIGRVGREPESRNAQSGSLIAKLSVACSEKRNGQEETEWFNVVCFGKTAEFAQNYLHKGRMVYVEGRMKTRKWQDQNGQERQTTELLADRLEGLDRPSEQQAPEQPAPRRQAQDMDDIPF